MKGDCKRCQSALEAGDLLCPVCGMLCGYNAFQGAASTQVVIRRCTECAAALQYDVTLQSATCGFCGAEAKLEKVTDPQEQAEGVIPATVSELAARDALTQFWARTGGWFRPADLSTRAQLNELKPLFWAAWVFDADAKISWSADSNAGAGLSSWAPHAGQHSLRFDDIVVSASRGLTAEETNSLVNYYQLETIEPLDTVDITAREHFDAQRSMARTVIAAHLEKRAVETLTRGIIPGNQFRNLQVAAKLRSLKTKRLLLPAYVASYEYGGRKYRAIVHGQNSEVVFGNTPKSWWKILTTILFCIALVALALTFLRGV